jgi:Xaa-Pro aminopeptidase
MIDADRHRIESISTQIDVEWLTVIAILPAMTDIASMKLGQDELLRSVGRLDRLRSRLAQEGLPGMVIEHEVDIWYLTGFVGHSATLVIGPDVAAILCDARYEEYLKPWADGGVHEVLIGPRHTVSDRIRSIVDAHGLDRLAFQSEHMTVSSLQSFQRELESIDFIGTAGHLSALRSIKDDHEVLLIERCIKIQQEALLSAFTQREPRMSEADFTALLEYEMRRGGATGASFEPIIATGTNSSVIHHMPGDKLIQSGMLLVDWGARLDGYCSDLTRTFCIGPMPTQMEEIYDIVLEAQLAAIDACQPGADCAAVDAAARSIIANAGYGKEFSHGLGHGLGMDVHESPNFSVKSSGVLLEPGMVMTVEPGVYLPGIGGIRIEDDVLITEDGHRVLSSNLDKSRAATRLDQG